MRSSENMVLEAIARLAGLHDVLEQLLRGGCQERADASQPAPAQAPLVADGRPAPAAAEHRESLVMRQQPPGELQCGVHAARTAAVPLPACSSDVDPPDWDRQDDEGTLCGASLLASPPPGMLFQVS